MTSPLSQHLDSFLFLLTQLKRLSRPPTFHPVVLRFYLSQGHYDETIFLRKVKNRETFTIRR